MGKTLKEHLAPDNDVKRILSLDGGGIRGALTLGYLQKIESILRAKENNPNLLLCDYFDLIGGTSTGAIIAAGLSIGKSVNEIAILYQNLGSKIFGKERHWWNPCETKKYLKARFDFSALENSLQEIFGNITLGDEKVKTGLCIVAKRADTNSVWPLINHPKGKYYDSEDGKNKNIPLWQAIRASSAAPTFFEPILVDVGNGEKAAFIDGGVSMANNPALILLMVSTLQGFPFQWEMSEEKLTIVSVGTGYNNFQKQTGEIKRSWLVNWAKNIPNMLMQDSNWQNQILLQWLSNSSTPHKIDDEIGKLDEDYIGGKPHINYLRYNFQITENDLNSLNLDQHFTEKDVESLNDMSRAENREKLYEIGVAASKEILSEHFN